MNLRHLLSNAPRRTVRRFVRLARTLRRAARFEVHAFWRSRPVRKGTVLFEAFAGAGVLDNPEALFRELLRDPEFAHFRHTWVLNDRRRTHPARLEFARDRRVRFVRRHGSAYYRALATSEYLVNNATFPAEFGKRPGQIYLNTWHGTPLKTMGYDMPNGAADSANSLRNFVSADFLLSQNTFMTERMYADAYRLRGHFRGEIVEEGYPRVDRQRLSTLEHRHVIEQLEDAGVTIDHRRVVLYAPTWRGTSFDDPRDDVDRLVHDVDAMQTALVDEYVVLLRTHQVMGRFAGARPELARILAPASMPTNLLLGVADILVTDYSSIFFDFLATGRPIVFFTPDEAGYADDRGTYFDTASLPGVHCVTPTQVAAAVRAESGPNADDQTPEIVEARARRNDWQLRFTSHEMFDSARRVVDIVFRGHREGYRIRRVDESDRTSILVHVGGLASNGITSSALNLLNAIPSERFDVTVVYNRTASNQLTANQARIPLSARQFARVGGMNGSKVRQLQRRLLSRLHRARAHVEIAGQRALWDDEWSRVFGDARFDHVIDFSGYGPFWATLLLHAPGAETAIWLHNDLVAEVDRLVRGKRRMRHSLPGIFDLYPQYDHLVAVSESLARINEQSLTGRLLWPPVIGVARNLIDTRASEDAPDLLSLPDFPLDERGRILVPEWARRLAAHGDRSWFVSVGRYSPEKNQARLVRAFAALHRERPDTRLVLVGHGSTRGALDALVTELGLDDTAFVVGPIANPYPVLRASDCFVLSSDYEGQPMVLLEAAAVGMPIVSVRFATVDDALPDEGIHVVEQDDEALTQGMRDFLGGRVRPAHLEQDAYNAAALAEFWEAVGIRQGHHAPSVSSDTSTASREVSASTATATHPVATTTARATAPNTISITMAEPRSLGDER